MANFCEPSNLIQQCSILTSWAAVNVIRMSLFSGTSCADICWKGLRKTMINLNQNNWAEILAPPPTAITKQECQQPSGGTLWYFMRAITMYVHISLLLLLTDKKESVSVGWGGARCLPHFFFFHKGKITKLSTLLQKQKLRLKKFYFSVQNAEVLTLPKHWACKKIFWLPSPQLLSLVGEKILVVRMNKSPSG